MNPRASSENTPSGVAPSHRVIASDANEIVPSGRVIAPGATVGMLGGGQLGRMFALAAAPLGYRVVVFADHEDSPAGAIAHRCIVGDLSDRKLLDAFAQQCDVITLEFENIPADSVRYLAERVAVFPSADVLRIAQDRGIEKQTLAAAGLRVTPFRLVRCIDDALAAMKELGLPLVLKTTRDGYDGKGQWKIGSHHGLTELAGRGADSGGLDFSRPLIAEAWVAYQKEVSVIIARGHSGQTAVYPVFENRHRNHILDLTLCPAEVSSDISRKATEMAISAAEAISLVGLICIEFFLDKRGELLINEIAPRPHNSGHLSIEACHTSQFEQQLRAVCGLPLGSTELIGPAAAMVNLMGELWQCGEPDWTEVLQTGGAHLHLYDKGSANPGRKMGHITLVGSEGSGPPHEQLLQLRNAAAKLESSV
jgi:5-(carboxyamino)imidazole ribonucleotide synthase